MSAQSERPDALVGSLLGKVYRVLEPIGVGGMAVVYLVEHQTLLKRFAAKVLSLDLASSLEARARFIQEAHAASQLDHENIVSISDFGTTNDQRPFFVMELLRGQTLDRRLADGVMSIEEVVAVAVPVARALSHAHAEGIVHLDVKPENIFLVQRTRGRWGVKVVDFGIAKTPLNPRLNKLGETAGSPLFMAPEVCRGDDDVDQRADVYSFGILLYLMMCGRLPFDDDSAQRVLQMQLVELPPPPNEINTQLSPELAMVVERALAKHREDRYPSMEALLYDFAAALPSGADRLLIEAQSGAAAHETPFSESLSMRLESHPRPSSLPPISPISPLRAQRRNTPMLLVTVAVVAVLVGLVTWRQLVQPSRRKAERTMVSASASVPSGAATTPAASAPPATDPATAEPAATDHATADRAAAEPAATATAPGAAATAPAPSDPPAPSADPAIEIAPQTGEPTEVARVEPTPVPERQKIDRPAAATKKPLLRSKPPARPVVRAPIKPVPAVAKAPPKRGPVVAAAAVATPAAATPAAEPAGDAPETGSAREARRPADTEVQASPAAPEPPDAAVTPAPAAPAPGAAPVKPATTARPSAPAPGSLDATPSVVSVEVKGSLSPSIVKRSVERSLPSLRSCYRTAARTAKATPAVELRLSFEIDENSLATKITTSGASFGSLAACVAGVTSQIRTQEAPDVGTAQVTAVIRFRPS